MDLRSFFQLNLMSTNSHPVNPSIFEGLEIGYRIKSQPWFIDKKVNFLTCHEIRERTKEVMFGTIAYFQVSTRLGGRLKSGSTSIKVRPTV